jgi:hypothetical protein
MFRLFTVMPLGYFASLWLCFCAVCVIAPQPSVSPACIAGSVATDVILFQKQSRSVVLPPVDFEHATLQTNSNPSSQHSDPPFRLLRLFEARAVDAWRFIDLRWVIFALFCCLCLCGSAAGSLLLKQFAKWTHEEESMRIFKPESGSASSDSEVREESLTISHWVASSDDSPSRFVEDSSGGKLYEEYLKEYWKAYGKDEEPDIFEHDNIRICNNGGMKDVPNLEVRYWKALYLISVGLLNCILVVWTDVGAINGYLGADAGNASEFLISKKIMQTWLAPEEQQFVLRLLGGDVNRLFYFLELSYMSYITCECIICAILSAASPHIFTKHGHLRRWTFASNVFWYGGPSLACCNALRLLHFVWPQVVLSDGWLCFHHARQMTSGTKRHYANAVFHVVKFFFARIVCLVLGLDAFLVKFRQAVMSFATSGKLFGIMQKVSAAAFLWQVGSIIHLNWFLRDRLFIFIFGGKHGYLDLDEMALMEVWKALFARKVFETFGLWRGTVVLIAFDDYSMQYLVLDDDQAEISAKLSYTRSLRSRERIKASLAEAN